MQVTQEIAAANLAAEQLQNEAEGEASPTDAEREAARSYRAHLEKVIDLATQVIAMTHLDPEAEQPFNNAVHYLSDARLELASTGDAAQARLLMEDADSLYERDKGSFAAAEAGFKVVELAERMAQNLGRQDTDWLVEFATQAQRFAQRFPAENSRSALLLFNAGRLCDRFDLTEKARECLEKVQSQYPQSVFADQSAGLLRRLSLRGAVLELSGATIDGGFADVEHYRGRPVLVVFWASTSPTFIEHLPNIKDLDGLIQDGRLAVIGINLDTDEAAVDSFVAEHQITWPQIFSADPLQRGGRHPLARYYGIQVLPTCWLIDADGIVVEDRLRMDELPSVFSKSIKND